MKLMLSRRILFVVGILALVLSAPIGASAQGDLLPPAIIQFTVDLPTVALPDIEAGTAVAALTWQTSGVTSNHRLLLYYFRIANWELVTPDSLPGAGVARVLVQQTLDFSPPMFRLAIVDRANQVISQQIVVIPYDPDRDAVPAVIETFAPDSQSVNYNLLALNQARINVTWRIANRSPLSNLVFEQILPDGSTRSVELPRLSRWIGSSGQGLIAPVLPSQDATALRIRLRVVDFRSGDTVAERELLIPIVRGGQTGGATTPPIEFQTPTPTPNP